MFFDPLQPQLMRHLVSVWSVIFLIHFTKHLATFHGSQTLWSHLQIPRNCKHHNYIIPLKMPLCLYCCSIKSHDISSGVEFYDLASIALTHLGNMCDMKSDHTITEMCHSVWPSFYVIVEPLIKKAVKCVLWNLAVSTFKLPLLKLLIAHYLTVN